MPNFRVGFLGRGSVGLRKFPFTQYSYPESAGWGAEFIEEVMQDFFGEDRGILFCNWDLSRIGWLLGPQYINKQQATAFGLGRNFDTWVYTPVDSLGPNMSTLGVEQSQIAQGADRVLAPSEWGAGVLKRSGRPDADWIPHGIFGEIFKVHENPRPLLGVHDDIILAGCVMSNQARKDWPVAFECAAVLKAEYGNRFKLWCHTDTLVRHWNLYALAADYGVQDCIEITLDMNDEQLALRYSACDCTILPSASEGFGYTIAESMFCGTACVVTDYAAGQELVPEECRVRPVTYRVDTIHNVRRAVLSGYGFAAAAKGQIEAKRKDWMGRSEELREQVIHLNWSPLKTVWQRWFLAGLK